MSIEQKIAALIAKAQSTQFEHEADAFMAKAQELMVKHAISLAEIEAGTGVRSEEIASVEFEIPNVVGKMDRDLLLQRMAKVFGCRGYTKATEGWEQVVIVVGYPADILNCYSLWASLCIQLDRFYLHARDNGDHVSGGRKVHHRKFKADFSSGFCNRVIVRVRERYETTVGEDATPGAAIVLRDRRQAVNDFVDATLNLSKQRHVKRSGIGVAAGANAGNRANISNGSNTIGQNTRLLGS